MLSIKGNKKIASTCSQILLNANDSGNEASRRYTHAFGVRIFLLAGNISALGVS